MSCAGKNGRGKIHRGNCPGICPEGKVLNPCLTDLRRTPIFCQLSKFSRQILLGRNPCPSGYEFASVGHHLLLVKFLGSIAYWRPKYERPKKVDFGCV